ncbi:MAG: TetR/AcrR family transcriptional regulator [Clostridia bacterium]|nr:TetR/AcrR family transcriptional regulator [Clostridia bacterium]
MAAPRKDNVKNIIMDVTEELLDNHSLADISLAEIATKAGISKGTLYYHYKTKEEILLDITDRFLDQQWNNFLIWVDNKDKDTSLHRLIKYVVEKNVQLIGPRIQLISEACLTDSEVRQKLIDRYSQFQHVIATKIAERTNDNDADYLAWLCLLVSDGLIIQNSIENPNIDLDNFIKKTESFVEKFEN